MNSEPKSLVFDSSFLIRVSSLGLETEFIDDSSVDRHRYKGKWMNRLRLRVLPHVHKKTYDYSWPIHCVEHVNEDSSCR